MELVLLRAQPTKSVFSQLALLLLIAAVAQTVLVVVQALSEPDTESYPEAYVLPHPYLLGSGYGDGYGHGYRHRTGSGEYYYRG